MGVIITGMDMPKHCGMCPYCKEDNGLDSVVTYCDKLNQDITWNNNRVNNCPLRSVEGLIEEIKEMKKTSDVTGQGVWNECLHYVIETIEEYCKGGE